MSERVTLLNGALTVSSGVNRFDAPMRVDAALNPGLKIVVLLSGRMQIKIADDPQHDICGPASIVIKNNQSTPRRQVYAPDIPVRYALVQMDDSCTGEELCGALDALSARAGVAAQPPDAMLLTCPAGRMQQSLARQIIDCPFQGAERGLYIGGKALQLAALTVAQCISEAEIFQAQQFSSRDIDRIRSARDILVAEMRKPPSLNALAQRVGLNVRKLTLGFRHVFGSTVFGFLQEHRLETAYKLLAAGEMSVSEAAYHVGYGAAHFTTIFRKRFGMSPSELG